MSLRHLATTLLVALLILPDTVDAQITIESSAIGSLIGTTVEQSDFSADAGQSAAIEALYNQSGENQTWDFSSLAWTADGTVAVDYVDLPAELPGSEDARVADANYAIRSFEPPGQDQYQLVLYRQLTSSGNYSFGSYAFTEEGESELLYDSALLETPFPLAYGMDPWEGMTSYQLSGGGLTQDVTIELDGQITGWGTLILPGEDPTNALRLEETRTTTTTVVVNGTEVESVTQFTNISFISSTLTSATVSQTPDGFGGTTWSASYSVVGAGSGTEPPASAPTNLDPADGATDVATNPTVSWDAVGSADTYDLQVATDASFSKRSAVDVIVDETGLTSTSFEVSGLQEATEYFWRVRGVNSGGNGPWSDAQSFTTVAGTSIDARNAGLPAEFALVGTYPNPFNPSTTITFDVAESMPVRVTIHDMLGRELSVLVNRQLSAGRYDITWDAGVRPSGSYLVRLQAGGYSYSQTIVLLK